MVAKRWRNASGNRIRRGGGRMKDEDCCCDCTQFPFCLWCGSVSQYTSPDALVTWPADVHTASLICIGRGGDGGDDAVGSKGGGGGGGGGSAIVKSVVDTSGNLEVIVNHASNSYAAEVKQSGSTACIAYAGGDGGNSSAGGPGSGGAGGSGSGDYVFPGGAGAAGTATAGVVDGIGGGGGGGAGTANAGGDGKDRIGGEGGNQRGGDGGDGGAGGNGLAGSTYGGGGGGGGIGLGAGGSGANGIVRIIWHELARLSLTISGAPSLTGISCTGPFAEETVDLTWGNLSTTISLTQDFPSSTQFTKTWDTSDAGALRSSGILVRKWSLTALPGSEAIVGSNLETEWYIEAVYASLSCIDGAMYINNFSFAIVECGRQQDWNGSSWDDWTEWTCGSILTSDHPLCGIGTATEAAEVCTQQIMETEIVWAAIISPPAEPCTISYDCLGTFEDPTVGTVLGKLSCDFDGLSIEADAAEMVASEEDLTLWIE